MKNIIFSLAIAFVLLFGCTGNNAGSYRYKGTDVPVNYIPAACGGKTDCALFACMSNGCWCKPTAGNGIVFEGGNMRLVGTSEVAAYTQAYLDGKGVKYTKVRAVALNNMFYNVFFQLEGDGEQMLTVGIDGTIMETVCGV
ncbi:Uncharacterised protein [Candidatus Anstonella stagnisolia]|nr:Uncharacterised protein [Candidatus Anstonella stagnisolia]